MSTPYPTPYELGQKIGGNISGAFEQAREQDILGQILSQAGQAKTPQQNLDLMGSALKYVSPERRGDVMDFLKNRYQLAQENAAVNEFMQGGQPLQGQAGFRPARQMPEEEAKVSESVRTPQGTAQESGILLGTPEAIDERARQRIARNPARYRGIEGVEKARAEERAAFNDQQTLINNAGTTFDSSVQAYLQKPGAESYKDITGEMQEEYRKKLEDEVALGKGDPRELAQKYAKELLEFAKVRSSLGSNRLGALFGTGLTGRDAQSKMRSARPAYEKAGRLDLFEKDLINKAKLSAPAAASLAYPVYTNPKIDSFVKDTKNRFSINPFKKGLIPQLFGGVSAKNTGRIKRSEEDIAKFIAKPGNLRPTDSLISIANSFNARGYDPQKILTAVEKLNASGDFLNDRQKLELSGRPTFGATLSDIAYFSASGFNPLELINGG